MSAVEASSFAEGGARRILRLGLGALWMLDGLLQLQPVMFTRALVDGIWQPAAQGQPQWLADLMNWSIAVASPHLVSFNWVIAICQLCLGALLLSGRRRPVWLGLWASAAFALAVWLFGEGMGQVLTGGATLLTGAPGSTFVYLAASVLLLLPVGAWRPSGHRQASAPALAAGTLMVLCGLFQFHSAFWTSAGLAAPFGQAAAAPQPVPLHVALGATSGLVAGAPILVNVLLIAVLVGGGLLLVAGQGEAHVALIWSVLAFLAVLWVLGQDVGMLFSGAATDPNTAPALGLLLASELAGRTTQAGSALFRHQGGSGRPSYAHR